MDPELRSLLDRPAWARALAFEIARDAEAADDLVQDTWIAALARPPRRGVPVRRWFARVMRNSARDGLRREGARRDREGARPAPPAPLDPAALLERLELQRQVALAVRALDEPYRSTVLLRWFEGLEPAEIAVRTGTPVRTVHSRIHRGLKLLRERLAPTDPQERSKWIAGLLAFTRRSEGAARTGTLVMSTKLKLAAVGAVAAGVIAYTQVPRAGGETAAAAEPGTLASTPVEVVEPEPDVIEAEADRRELVAESELPAPELDELLPTSGEAIEPVPITGSVIDLVGTPLAGVPVLASPFGREPSERTTSDAQGAFELADAPPSCTIDAGPPWATVLQPRLLDHNDRAGVVLVVARAIDLAGTVRDPDGLAIPSVQVELAAPGDLRVGLDHILDESHTREWKAATDGEGRFEILGAPALEGASIVASARGWRTVRVPLPPSGDVALDLVLEPDGEPVAWLAGRVVTEAGAPVAGARVAIGGTCAQADGDGTFRMELRDVGEDRTLAAQAPGWLPTRLQARPGVEVAQAFPEPLVVVLADRPLTLRGRVLDADGRPAVGVEVWTPDTSEFGTVQPFDDQPGWRYPASVESVARDEIFFGESSETDADGRFELRGLEDRPYSVVAFDSGAFRSAQSEPVRPGGEVEIRLPPRGPLRSVEGRVLTLGGAPVEGAKVSFGAVVRVAVRGEDATREEVHLGPQVVTDSEGRFAQQSVPGAANRIRIDGGGLAQKFEGEVDPKARELEYRLPVLCHLQVVTTDSDLAWLRAFDADGEPVALRAKHGWVETGSHRRGLTDGRSEVLRVSEAARTLVLGRGDEELLRMPIELVPGELVVIRP